jgi:hypothetical protein
VVSRWLHTSVARVRAQVRSRGICGAQSGTGAGYFRVFQFPLTILIPPTVPQSSSCSIRGGTIGQLVADVPSGLSLTPPQETTKKLTKASALERKLKELIVTNFDSLSLYVSGGAEKNREEPESGQ